MAIDFARLPTQIGALLIILAKIEARLLHARDADNSNYDRRLIGQANAFLISDNEEAKILGGIVNYLDSLEVPRLQELYASLRAQIESQSNGLGYLLFRDLPNKDSSDVVGDFAAYDYDESLNTGAQAIIRRSGLLGALRRNMEANGQYVAPDDVELDVLIPDDHNSGSLDNYSESAEDHALDAELVITVTSENVSRTTCSVVANLTTPLPDGTTIIEADRELVAEQSWENGPLGITMVLRRPGLDSPTEVDADLLFSAVSLATPQESDCDTGVFHCRVTRQSSGATWLIEFFANSGLTRKRGRSTSTGTSGTETITVELVGGSSITFTFDRAAANTAMAVANETAIASWDIRQPREKDVWRRRVTNFNLTNFNGLIKRSWRFSFPTSGTTQWTESLAEPISQVVT